MINSHNDYKSYLEADRVALGVGRKHPRFLGDDIWKFQRLLRRLEYLKNCKRSVLGKVCFLFSYYCWRKLGIKLGFSIPLNVFGPGLAIAHQGTIVVNETAKVGANCRIHVCVNIGTGAGLTDAAPVIGNNVYIGPGVKMFGKIVIADGIAIGANAVVNKSFLEPGITIAGVPARKISSKGSAGLTR